MTGIRTFLAALLIAACSDAHEAALDAAMPRPDAHVADANIDAACSPARELPQTCTARWATGWPLASTTYDARQIRQIEVAGDGTILSRVVVSGGTLVVAGTSLTHQGVFALDADGAPRWGFDRASAGPSVDANTVWAASEAFGATQLSLATGATMATRDTPFGVDRLTLAACDGCEAELLIGGNWLGSTDLGPLGVQTADDATTLLDLGVAPRWQSTVVARADAPPGPGIDLILPRRASTLGAIVAWHDQDDSRPFCPITGGSCVDWPGSVLASYGADGAVRWSASEANGVEAIEQLADGGAVVAAFTGLVRYDGTGHATWRNEVDAFVEPIAVDEARGRVWSVVSVPVGRSLHIADATLADCLDGRASAEWSWNTIVASFDLATGEPLTAFLPAEGLFVTALALRPDGGLVIGGALLAPADAIDVCGSPATAIDSSVPIAAIIASIDPP